MQANTEHSVSKWNDLDGFKLYIFNQNICGASILFFSLLLLLFNIFSSTDDDCMRSYDLCFSLSPTDLFLLFACLEKQFLFLFSYFCVFVVHDLPEGFSFDFMQSYTIQ